MKTLPNTITRWEEIFSKEYEFPLEEIRMVNEYNTFIQFIKLPLKPWMFIPWDMGKNCPLEEPDKDNMAFYTHKNISIQEEYQQAKERVLFDGFNGIKFINLPNYNQIINHLFLYGTIEYEGKQFKTIQDLVDKVTLTPTGEKEAGL